MLTEKDWPIIGHFSKLLANREIPLLRASYSIYYKDKFMKTVSRDELKDYVQLEGQGKFYLEDKLRDHFGLE